VNQLGATKIGFYIPSVPFGNVLEQISITGRCEEQLGDVHVAISSRMQLLVSMTRDLPDGYLRLQVQRRIAANTGESLRWVDGAKLTIISEGKAEEIISGYPEKLRDWYASVQAEARWLNVQERLCRQAKKEVSSLSMFLLRTQKGAV
jgi:hypothetical protein